MNRSTYENVYTATTLGYLSTLKELLSRPQISDEKSSPKVLFPLLNELNRSTEKSQQKKKKFKNEKKIEIIRTVDLDPRSLSPHRFWVSVGSSPGVILELRELDRDRTVQISDRTGEIKVQDLFSDNEERQLRVLPLRAFTPAPDPRSLDTVTSGDCMEEERIRAMGVWAEAVSEAVGRLKTQESSSILMQRIELERTCFARQRDALIQSHNVLCASPPYGWGRNDGDGDWDGVSDSITGVTGGIEVGAKGGAKMRDASSLGEESNSDNGASIRDEIVREKERVKEQEIEREKVVGKEMGKVKERRSKDQAKVLYQCIAWQCEKVLEIVRTLDLTVNQVRDTFSFLVAFAVIFSIHNAAG
jgi:hypothetical protein